MFSLSIFKYMHYCIIIYVIWKVLPLDIGIVCCVHDTEGQQTDRAHLSPYGTSKTAVDTLYSDGTASVAHEVLF